MSPPRTSFVAGAHFGPYVVLETPPPGAARARVRCTRCDREHDRALVSLREARTRAFTGCIACREDRRTSMVAGARFGSFVVLETPGPNAQTVHVRCRRCGHETTPHPSTVFQARSHGFTSCLKCRARTHLVTVSCRECRRKIRRPYGPTERGHVCKPCAKRVAFDSHMAWRERPMGRTCDTCGATDAERPFDLKAECSTCNRAAMRNGRCSCRRAIRRTRPCPCGAPAQVTTEEIAARARAAITDPHRERDALGRFRPASEEPPEAPPESAARAS